VLLAEDNPTHRVLMDFILKNELNVADVEYARDGQEAHKILKNKLDQESRQFDWVILDYSMPIIDGITVV
jgi:CheY-like chemotaxis protein